MWCSRCDDCLLIYYTFVCARSCSFSDSPVSLARAHCASAPQTSLTGDLCLRGSLTTTRHQGQWTLQCFQLPGGVTSPSSPADATPLKRGSQRQLACDVVLLFDCRGCVALYASEMCRVTQSALWTTKTPEMTFPHTARYWRSIFFSLRLARWNTPEHTRHEVEHNAGMMGGWVVKKQDA